MKQPYDILQEQFTELRKLYEATLERLRAVVRENEQLKAGKIEVRLSDMPPAKPEI